MRYIKLTLQYLRKNFLYILPLVIAPAIIVGAGTEPCSMLQFFVNFQSGEYVSFGDIFAAHSEINWLSVLLAILLLPVICVSLSALCGIVTRHLRYGILNFDKLHRRINFNFLPVLKMLLLFLALIEIYAVLTSCLSFIWVSAFDVTPLSHALIIVCNSVLFAVMIMVMVLGLFALPSMSVNGLNLRQALAESIHTVKSKFWSLTLAVILPILLPYVVMGLLSVFDFWWRRIINPIIYIGIFAYYMVLMFVAYYDIKDIDREDIREKYPIEEM